jgi:hypothetical protein
MISEKLLDPLVKTFYLAQSLLFFPCPQLWPHSNDVETGGKLGKIQLALLALREDCGAGGGTLVPLKC